MGGGEGRLIRRAPSVAPLRRVHRSGGLRCASSVSVVSSARVAPATSWPSSDGRFRPRNSPRSDGTRRPRAHPSNPRRPAIPSVAGHRRPQFARAPSPDQSPKASDFSRSRHSHPRAPQLSCRGEERAVDGARPPVTWWTKPQATPRPCASRVCRPDGGERRRSPRHSLRPRHAMLADPRRREREGLAGARRCRASARE